MGFYWALGRAVSDLGHTATERCFMGGKRAFEDVCRVVDQTVVLEDETRWRAVVRRMLGGLGLGTCLLSGSERVLGC